MAATASLPPPPIGDHSAHQQLPVGAHDADFPPQEKHLQRKARTIGELIEIKASEQPSQPIISYPSQGIEYVDYTYANLQDFSSNCAGILGYRLPLRQASTEAERVVAILGPSDFDYLINVLALSSLGFTVLFLSTRISDAAYESLLNATGCEHIICYPKFSETVANLKRLVPNLTSIERITMQQYSQATPYSTGQLDPEVENRKISWIIHSSGSTGMPKPIHQTHDAALRNYENNMNMKGFITLPLFHAHGLSSVLRAVTSRKQIHMYNADLPLTKETLLSIFQRHSFEIFYGVPYALKLLSESPDGIAALAALKVVMFGGSACPDALGDILVENGVNLISHYGTTETGQLMTSFRSGDKAWNYVRVHDALDPYVRWEPRGGNLYELVILDGWRSKVATNRDDGAYATKDLFEPHPTIPKAWKFAGRSDDTIVLLNGEKVIPISTEQAVRQNPNIKDDIIFGSGKPQLGMIIIPSEAAKDLSEAELIEKIWPTIQKSEEDSPSYARLLPQMVKALPWDTKFPQTDKGTLIRQAFYRQFSQEIQSVYEAFDDISNGTLQLSEEELRAFVREKLSGIMVIRESEGSIDDTTDFFSLGMDSLQAIRLRTAFRDLDLGGHTISQNVVFENPSISQLARKLYCMRTGEEVSRSRVEDDMTALIEKYSDFPAHVPVESASTGRSIVVTGATGSLGAHLVARLVRDPEVKTIWALVRASDEAAARTRVLTSLGDRLLLHNLSVPELRKIRALPSNFADEGLGLGSAYEALCNEVTDVIHSAWSVNFNKSLQSFDDCIFGARNLMLLCLRAKQPAPASFNFCSSVSAVARTPNGYVPECLPESLEYAQGMGYAQSKLVTEHLVERAARSANMKARVLRIGQICADTVHGIWNDTEAIPIMIEAAITIKALPALDERLRWLPVDSVAQSVCDLSLSGSASSQVVFNVVNPQTFHWTDDLLQALKSSGLQFEEVTQREWISRLRSSNQDPVQNPPVKLLEFFASKYDNDTTHRPGLDYETSNAEALSPSLTNVGVVDSQQIQKFIRNICQTSWASLIQSQSISLPGLSLSTPQHHVLVIAGPCGVGKSTVGETLSRRLQCTLVEGDSHHDERSITKMANVQPLDPIDRSIWLARLKVAILKLVRDDGHKQVVVTCSALRKEYRDQLRNLAGDGSVRTHFVMLGEEDSVLTQRLENREGHYMTAAMVKSQLETLEATDVSEVDSLPEDASLPVELIVQDILDIFQL
ncbi:aminoadipate-semialdehyde dehydrogenase large subunit [Xylariales sp. PMI_506]|nr:aminoadipate-semialdehyde dehydrogenase large subunit [Xylariales sp. PMI_506]